MSILTMHSQCFEFSENDCQIHIGNFVWKDEASCFLIKFYFWISIFPSVT